MKIHPTAVIDTHAELDSTVEVGPFCVIGPNVRIGKNTRLLSHAVVEGWTQIGEENTIFPFSVIGAVPQDLKYKGEKTTCIIGNHNLIREGVSIHLGTAGGGGVTRVGDHNLLMGYVHIGHDATVGNHNVFANYVGLAGHVIVEDYVTLSGYVVPVQFTRVGSYSFATAQTVIEKSVPPFCVVSGPRPTTIRGVNIVGLRRRGFSAESISGINEVVKLWTRLGVERETSLQEIEAQFGDREEIRRFIKFIRDSKDGVLK